VTKVFDAGTSSTFAFPDMDIGIVNYKHNYDAEISPALLRVSGYVGVNDPTKIAVFFHSFTPFYVSTDEG